MNAAPSSACGSCRGSPLTAAANVVITDKFAVVFGAGQAENQRADVFGAESPSEEGEIIWVAGLKSTPR